MRRRFSNRICRLEDRLTPAPFTPGNLLVYRVGDGVASLTNDGSPVFLDELTPAGVVVQSIAMPTIASGANKQLIAAGVSADEGLLTRSVDGRSVVLTGYARDLGGTSGLPGTNAATVNRTVGRVDFNGSIDTGIALSDFASGGNPRGVVTIDGSAYWLTGETGGPRYLSSPANTTTIQLSTQGSNLTGVGISNGQLYVAHNSAALETIGLGTPTTTGQDMTNLPGFPTGGTPYQFFFADLTSTVPGDDTLYVSDSVRAFYKYSLVGGDWESNGKTGIDGDNYRGLTGAVTGNTVTLFAVRKGGSGVNGGGEIVSITDSTGYNGALVSSPVLLATAATKTAFRGITMTPENSPGWTTKTPMGGPRESSAVATIGTTIYIAGGFTGFDATSLQAYNALTNTWTNLKSMPAGRYLTDGAAVINGKIYVPGGWDNTVTFQPHFELFIYDPATNSWSNGTNMPTKSASGISGAINNKLYVTTAANGAGPTQSELNVYDPVAGTWTSLAQSPHAHAAPAGGVIDGKFYVAGGANITAGVINFLDVYDPATNTWTTKASMPTPVFGAASAILDGKLYVMGGYSASNTALPGVQIYDPGSDTWTAGPPLRTTRGGLMAGVVNAAIYAIGGFSTANSYVNATEAYNLLPPKVASVQINGGAAQRSRVTTVRVDFNSYVTLPANPALAFQLKRQSDDASIGLNAVVTNDTVTHVTLTFSGPFTESQSLMDGRYTLTVLANQVSNAGGMLDGDANGIAGGDHVLASEPQPNPPTNIFRLFGDVNGDGFTDNIDLIAFRSANGSDSLSPNWNPAFDSNGDGFIDNQDFIAFRQRLGLTL